MQNINALPVWLPGGAGLVSPGGGAQPQWIHETDDGWVVEAVPSLADLRSAEVLLVIPG